MENMTNPVFPVITSAWQPRLSALGCATSAFATLEVQGIAARPATVATGVEPFAVVAAEAAKRERIAGTDHRGSSAAYVPGVHAWSPPI
ncbi:hypothetical protein [Nocardioides daeguensis]|uniref:Uncharacterized protein n=1 Tax=Nocardioides daeguensis TaxID=908359 RepID=A0ABP6VQ59_9ACTN|nr:hypothetical protein [Nocardioides daeguensis]MBV6728509.1 hypothetical protein [Nocardioides daeguensis]MCR1773933.1 hypothetical protein [Nocardioides daeguensis]